MELRRLINILTSNIHNPVYPKPQSSYSNGFLSDDGTLNKECLEKNIVRNYRVKPTIIGSNDSGFISVSTIVWK